MPGRGDSNVNRTELTRGSSVPLCHVIYAVSQPGSRPPCALAGPHHTVQDQGRVASAAVSLGGLWTSCASTVSVHSASHTAPRTEEAPPSVNDVAKLASQFAAAGLDSPIHSLRAHPHGVERRVRVLLVSTVRLRCRLVRLVGSSQGRWKGKYAPLNLLNHTEPHLHSIAVQVQVRGSVSNSYYCNIYKKE